MRTAIAKAIDHLAKPSVSWADFIAGFERLSVEPGSPLQMSPERFVAEFIGPNMIWQHDWADELIAKGALPRNSRLPERVGKRLVWQAVSEFTYLSHRGRNLDRIGKATLGTPIGLVHDAARQLAPTLREQFGIHGADHRAIVQWLWGFLAHLRRRGAVWHEVLGSYAKDGKVWPLVNTQGRGEWMPPMGERTPRPVLLSLGVHRDFDRLTSARRHTWFENWAEATLGRQTLLAEGVTESLYLAAINELESRGLFVRTTSPLGDTLALAAEALVLTTDVVQLSSGQGKRKLTVPSDAAEDLRGMPCLDASQETYDDNAPTSPSWFIDRFSHGDLRRVIAAEHTSMLERPQREALELRFKSKDPKPWFENLLSATPTLELGVDIGDLSSVLLCAVPPNQASYLQRVGRAGRRDGNAMTVTLADGGSPHDLYFFEEVQEMLAGEVAPPGIFLKAAEVLRRQLFAFCLDDWVGGLTSLTALPDKTRFPYTFTDHVLKHEPRLLQAFLDLLGDDIDAPVIDRLSHFMGGTGDGDGLRLRLMKVLEELMDERKLHKKASEQIKIQIAAANQRPQDEATREESNQLKRERDNKLELVKEINQRDLLNTFTDAGLIPNYAFPEAGIQLKSVLWRRRAADDRGDGAYVALPAQKFERPANSALSEFAPENRFYANQRRVEVDQINMGLAKLEWWRLCPSCHHMENIEVQADTHAACPRCGEAMWTDQSQRRQLLRFRQAVANSDDTKVRIDDSADDRDPGEQQLRRDAAWATFLMVPSPGSPEAERAASQMKALASTLPGWMHDLPQPHAVAASREGSQPSVSFWWPAAFASAAPTTVLTPGLLVLEDDETVSEATQHEIWRRWLALFNTLQVLSGFVMATRRGLQGGDCEILAPSRMVAPATDGPGAAIGAGWQVTLDSAVVAVRAELATLADAGIDTPEVGYEYPDENGSIVAEAELAWPRFKVVVLLESQIEFTSVWSDAGWQAVPATGSWADTVRAMLGRQR